MKVILRSKINILIIFLLWALDICPQNITVGDFQSINNPLWKKILKISPVEIDKSSALLEMSGETKGFTFSTPGGNNIETTEDDGKIILKIPDKTRYILISHPDYGEYTWRVPVKYLKKNHRYSARIVAQDLTKEFKNQNQWAIFNFSPENVIVSLDSTIYKISDGNLALYLPVGQHSLKVESPFYEEFNDSISLSDSIKLQTDIFLQPIYSYLTVRTNDQETEIYIDEKPRGREEVTLGRIGQGSHRISLLRNNDWITDTIVNVDRAEKKTIEFPFLNNKQQFVTNFETFDRNPTPNIYRELSRIPKDPLILINELKNKNDSLTYSEIHLTTEDSLALILVDREQVGRGEWTGVLEKGLHLITAEKDGYESVSQFIEIIDSSPKEYNIFAPRSGVGMVNIMCNVNGAEIIRENKIIGYTPSLLKDLESDVVLTLKIRKEGFKEKEIEVIPNGNSITEIFVELRKK